MIGEVVNALHEALTESDPIERFVFVEEQNSLSVKRSDTFFRFCGQLHNISNKQKLTGQG